VDVALYEMEAADRQLPCAAELADAAQAQPVQKAA